MNTPYRLTIGVLTLFMGIILSIPGWAGERLITIRDYAGWGFPPDLVTYDLHDSSAMLQKLRVIGTDGHPLATQVNEAATKDSAATLSFVAEVPPDGTMTYTVRDDGKDSAPLTAVATHLDGTALVLENGLFAVRVPRPERVHYRKPVAANTLPAPLQAFRIGNGPWLGATRMRDARPVTDFNVTLTANGPVYVEVSCEYRYADGGYYRASVQVIDQVPMAKIREEYDARAMQVDAAWELDLGHGWAPDRLERGSEGGALPATSVSDLLKARPAIGTRGSAGELATGNEPDLVIFPSYNWHRQGSAYLGLWREQERQVNPDTFARVGFVPLNKGQWRMVNGVKVHFQDGAVSVSLPLSTRYANWHEDSASYTSPFSIGQLDPNLPRSLGRRVWGLLLAPLPATPASVPPRVPVGANTPVIAPKTWRQLANANANPNKDSGLCWRTRMWYGTVGLDRYKNYLLDWPATTGAESYPRVFNTRQDLERFKPAFDTLSKEQQDALRHLWGFTHEPKVAADEVTRARGWLKGQLHYAFDTYCFGHHDLWGQGQFWADDVLAWPDLPAADRRELRALVALAAYVMTEPDVVSSGIGDHTGNPNMSVSRQQTFANFAALLPDHPLRFAWSRYMGEFAEYKLAENEAPGGGWFEFGGYHTHGFYAAVRGFPGQLVQHAPNADRIWPYLRDDIEYFLNLLTPVDPRYGTRIIPGVANSANMVFGHFAEWSAATALKDSNLASRLRWAYLMSGKQTRHTDYGGALLAWDRPWIAPTEPALQSSIFPGVGVIFRAHQGPDETYMFFRSGYCWSHWYVDQGHFVLYGKGMPLVPAQHYQYYWPKDNTHNMYNTIRFGHPENECAYAWPDSNILDHAFGRSLDYAWASMGYPEWYITPGSAPGFGTPRKLSEVAGQQEGAFHWNRQILFLKGATGKSPNYFVFRDTFPGAGQLAAYLNLNLVGRPENVTQRDGHLAIDTEWPVKVDVVFAGEHTPPAELIEDNPTAPTYTACDAPVVPMHPSRYWRNPKDNSPISKIEWGTQIQEQRVLVRVPHTPRSEYFWLLYPRSEHEPVPPAFQLAPGVMKVSTAESTDYVFLSTQGIVYTGEGVTFSGGAGAVRLGTDGTVTLAMTGGSGKVGYNGYILQGTAPFERTIKRAELTPGVVNMPDAGAAMTYKPGLSNHQVVAPGVRKAVASGVTEYLVDANTPVSATDGNVHIAARQAAIIISPVGIRFVAPEHTFVELTVGNQGVRGVGPFDLTFMANAIIGMVNGDTRTLVVTRPANILKPMYHMDGWRYYAGYADDSSADDGRTTPQFNVAFGVTAGKHQITIAEWNYPSLPPTLTRRRIE